MLKIFNPDDPDTLSGTTITVAAVYAPDGANVSTELRFRLDVVHHNYGWCDRVILTFPPTVTIISSPPFEAGGEMIVPQIIGQETHYGITDGFQTQCAVFQFSC